MTAYQEVLHLFVAPTSLPPPPCIFPQATPSLVPIECIDTSTSHGVADRLHNQPLNK